MAYIRNTSNPEKLYIWASSFYEINIQMGAEFLGKMPKSIFDNLLKIHIDNYSEFPCKYKGAIVDKIMDGDTFKIKFKYKNITFIMWETTWIYIILSNIERI